jgi:HEAT repeat protein
MAADDLESIDVDELVAAALALDEGADDDEHYWVLVAELQRRGDRETFAAARELCGEESEAARVLGVTVLGQLGYVDGRPFAEESVPLVAALCREAQGVDVLVASIRALGLLGRGGGADAVLSHVRHADESVRLAVAQSVAGVAGSPPSPAALAVAIELTHDERAEVRGWATFCLGSELDEREADAPAVREALLARIGDPDGDAWGEALVGLARRGGPAAVELIAVRLREPGEQLDPLVVEAAARAGDASLLPALRALKAAGRDARGADEGWLDAAIEACDGGPLREPDERA